MRASRALLRHHTGAGIVLARDLFLCNSQVNSTEKVSYQGWKPSFYSRGVTDFISETDTNGLWRQSDNVFETIELDSSFRKHLQMRISPIEKFLGDEFKLSFHDLVCILCGISNQKLSLGNEEKSALNQVFTKILIDHIKVQNLGERFFNLHSQCGMVFADPHHLSASDAELRHSLSLLDDRKSIITEFMKRNGLYNCIIPFRSPTFGTPLKPPELDEVHRQIKEETCNLSFFTLLGITVARYGTLEVLQKLWIPKILGTDQGILKIVTSKLTSSDTNSF